MRSGRLRGLPIAEGSMTSDKIARLRALLAAIEPGPYHHDYDEVRRPDDPPPHEAGWNYTNKLAEVRTEATAEAIAALLNAAPELLDAAERVATLDAEVDALHAKIGAQHSTLHGIATAATGRGDAEIGKAKGAVVALVRRVATLEAALRAVAAELRASADALGSGYGNFPGGDPREFTPDEECSTHEEREAHRLACEAWNRGEHKPVDAACQPLVSGDGKYAGHVTFSRFGLGSYTYRDEDTERVIGVANDALSGGTAALDAATSAAFRRGAEAMQAAAVKVVADIEPVTFKWCGEAHEDGLKTLYAAELRDIAALPIPEDK